MKQDSKNYKVRCVGYKRDERCFTIGKVYDVVDGNITNDNGYTYIDTGHYRDVIEFLSRWYKFERVNNNSVVSRVIFNNPATIILWSDGTKTIAKTHGDDAFDPEKGFAVACAKKLLGNGDSFRMEFAKWAPVDEEPNIDGFKVGDRVVYDHHIGTVIALAESGNVGVEFDEPGIGFHNCEGVCIKSGHMGTKGASRWFCSEQLKHFENRPLTEDELHSMQGKKVWLVSLDEDGKPDTDKGTMKEYGGWHTVKGTALYDEDGKCYNINNVDTHFGFHAYLEPSKK